MAEELKLLTIFVDGCTDFLFDKAVPNPHYIFRITNIQSADGVTCALAIAQTWPKAVKIAHIHPDYSYGRNAFDHLNIVMKKLMPSAKVVSEGWPKLGTTDFTSHITKAISAKPDLLVSSVWGGDYVAMYKQALRYDMFKKMKFASTIAFGVAPHAIGKDHPEGAIAGVHSNYYFNYPPNGKWPLNDTFVKKYFDRWKEYPNFQAEGAYVTLHMLEMAISRANKLMGGWPDDDMIISQLENLGMSGPAGYIYFRPDNHQAYKDAVTGFSINSPDYPFQILDPNADDHDPDPQHHGASRLAEGRADLDVYLDRQDLAVGEGLRRRAAPGKKGRHGRFFPERRVCRAATGPSSSSAGVTPPRSSFSMCRCRESPPLLTWSLFSAARLVSASCWS